MSESIESNEVPQAMVVVPKRRRLSVVWIIPVLAAVVAIGVAIKRVRSEGPTITIVFAAAQGIEAGKTLIKYKDVNIGQVKAVHLTEDYSKVEVTAKMTKQAEGLMVEDAKFWVVSPSISLSGVSGLNTLLSGNYIGFESGKSYNDERSFVGLEIAPFIPGKTGQQFVLKADDVGSLVTGSPVYYRRLPVGQVVSQELAADGKSVAIKVFVHAPYDQFVRTGSRFWKASGIDVVADANGVAVHTESVIALLVGGLSFDDPPFMPDKTLAPANAAFTLYREREAAMKAPNGLTHHYVLRFGESLRGLTVGAPVTLLGLTVGEVTGVGLAFDGLKASIRPRVSIALYPERLLEYAPSGQRAGIDRALTGDDKGRLAFMRRLVEERGLRAQLRSGSLLTGQLYVALDYFPKAAKAKLGMDGDVAELPVVASSLVDIETKLASVLEKVDKLPIEQVGSVIKKDLEGLDEAVRSANKLITRVDSELVPTLKADLEALHRTLGSVERTVGNADITLLGPNAPAQQELREALIEFARTARSVRVLFDYLDRHPESLIRGKADTPSGDK